MNLLTDDWIPVRPLMGGNITWIGLSRLLTKEDEYEICLPRDDLELAAIQLIICITQVLFRPESDQELREHIRKPMPIAFYAGKMESHQNWFNIEHPEHPFMQVPNVKANKNTPMGRLLPGLSDSTNSCFVNEPCIAKSLCGGCSAISIFNRASNAPSFGGGAQGGFKPGLRGSIPITTLIQGKDLRQTVWLNILTEEYLTQIADQAADKNCEMPTWVSQIKEKSTTESYNIGLLRGLFWQPALIELGSPNPKGICHLCGRKEVATYNYFITNQFGYNINGLWPHPHSPTYLTFKNNKIEKRFASFTNSAPSWTQLSRFVVKQDVDQITKEGQEPATVIMQAYKLFSKRREHITLLIGGYRNEPGKTASIMERRHETISLNKGWANSPRSIAELVQIGLGFKSALTSALFIFDKGLEDKKLKRKTHKGLGFSRKKNKYQNIGETQFFRRTDNLMQKALAEAHFEDPDQLAADKDALRSQLKQHCLTLFEEQTRPYLNDPELIKTMAVARRTLNKHLKALEPEGGES